MMPPPSLKGGDRPNLWHPHSQTNSKRFKVADFMYARRAEKEGVPKADSENAA